MWPGCPTLNFLRRISKDPSSEASREARSSGTIAGGGGRNRIDVRGFAFKSRFTDVPAGVLDTQFRVHSAYPSAPVAPHSDIDRSGACPRHGGRNVSGVVRT